MENGVLVTIKILPPFTTGSKSIEKALHLGKDPSIIDLLVEASSQGILNIEKVVDGCEVRDGVVILVNGRTVFNLRHRLNNGDRVAIMPLVPGGYK